MYSVILLAAGNGSRSGLSINKVFYEYKEKPILWYSYHQFFQDERCSEIIITMRKEDKAYQSYFINNKTKFCIGGNSRMESVKNALSLVTNKIVMIHDGARMFIDSNTINNLLQASKEHEACYCGVKCIDTIRNLKTGETLQRENYVQVQTPQVFHYEIINKAYHFYPQHQIALDDVSVYQYYTKKSAHFIEGNYNNIKITTKEDIKKL